MSHYNHMMRKNSANNVRSTSNDEETTGIHANYVVPLGPRTYLAVGEGGVLGSNRSLSPNSALSGGGRSSSSIGRGSSVNSSKSLTIGDYDTLSRRLDEEGKEALDRTVEAHSSAKGKKPDGNTLKDSIASLRGDQSMENSPKGMVRSQRDKKLSEGMFSQELSDETFALQLRKEQEAYEAENKKVLSLDGDEDVPLAAFKNKYQYEMYIFFEHPRTRNAIAFNFLSMFVILVSTLSVCLETLPEFYSEDPETVWFALEAVCVAFFTLEYALRLYAAPFKWRFIRSILNIIDVLAFLPFYFELVVSTSGAIDFRFLRMIRLARVFRIFKISRHSPGLKLTVKAIVKSKDALGLLSIYLLIAVVLYSCLMYYAERGEWIEAQRTWINSDNGQITAFQSIFHSMWWCIATITTVGYGDDVPVTPFGKLVASLAMLSGVMIIAFPTSILGTNFMSEWQSHLREEYTEKRKQEIKKLMEEGSSLSIRQKLNSLEKENQVMTESLAFVQELLEEVHPSEYYLEVKELRNKLGILRDKYRELELHNLNLETELNECRLKLMTAERRESMDKSGGGSLKSRMSGVKLVEGIFRRKGSSDSVMSKPATQGSGMQLKERDEGPVGSSDVIIGVQTASEDEGSQGMKKGEEDDAAKILEESTGQLEGNASKDVPTDKNE
eukprot:Nk52_evm5s233 gene=Nk52_evmTU5s233